MTSGRILPPLSLILPFWLVQVDGRPGVSHVRRLARAPGRSAGRSPLTQFAWSHLVSFELVDLASSVASLLAGVIVLQFWKPKDEWRFDHDEAEGDTDREIDRSSSFAASH